MLDIDNSAAASYFVQTAVRSHRDVYERIDNIEDYLIRLKKPYDEEALKESGFSWMMNANYGKGRAKVEGDVAENVADVINSLAFMRTEFRPLKKSDRADPFMVFLEDESLRTRFQDTTVNCYLDALEKDNYLGSFVNRIEYCVYGFGHCSVTRDTFGYLGYANHPRSIAYEDRTEICNVRNFCLFDVVKAEFLYNQLRELNQFDEKNLQEIPLNGDPIRSDSPMDSSPMAENEFDENGWCQKGLIEVFRRALIESEDNKGKDKEGKDYYICQYQSWQDIEAFVTRRGLPVLFTNVNNVFVCKIYYFNTDGEYIEVYVAVDGDVLSKNIPVPGTYKYLLYKKNWGKKNSNQVINVIRESTLNVNDWIHELKGAGKMIAEDSLRFDIKRCKLEDRLTLNGCAIMKTNSEFQGQQMKIAVFAGIATPESGVVIEESPFKGDLSQFVQSIEFDEANFARDTQHLAPKVSSQLHSRATKNEVAAVSSEVGQALGSKTPLKFKDYSDVLYNALQDLVNNDNMTGNNKEIQGYFFDSMKEALSDLGELTNEQIKKIVNSVIRVRFTPVIKDIQSIQSAMELTGNSEQRQRLQKMMLMALGFTRKDVNDLVDAEDYGEQVSIAAFENALFAQTAEIAFGKNQDHITHLNMHYAKTDRVLKGAAAGEDIVQAFHFLTNCLTNCQAHLAELEGSYFYKAEYKQFSKIQVFFTKKAIQLSQMIQKMKQDQVDAQQQQQQQAQQQPQLDPKTQASIYNDRIKMMDKIKRTAILTQDARQRKLEEFQIKMQLLQQETSAKIQNQSQLAELQKNLANVQASIKLLPQSLGQPQVQDNGNIQDTAAAA